MISHSSANNYDGISEMKGKISFTESCLQSGIIMLKELTCYLRMWFSISDRCT